MVRWSLIRVSVLALALYGCSDNAEKVEEPVQANDDAAGASPDAEEDAATFEGGGGEKEEADSDLSAPEAPAPQDGAMDAPAAQQPAPQPSGGGIISSGVKPIPGAECNSIAKFSERKKCFERAQKANK